MVEYGRFEGKWAVFRGEVILGRGHETMREAQLYAMEEADEGEKVCIRQPGRRAAVPEPDVPAFDVEAFLSDYARDVVESIRSGDVDEHLSVLSSAEKDGRDRKTVHRAIADRLLESPAWR